MATISDAEREELVRLLGDPNLANAVASSSEKSAGEGKAGNMKSGLQRAFKAMLEQSRGQAGDFASSLASKISGLPGFNRQETGLADIPPTQSGREELLGRVFGAGSRTGYSPTANRLDAFILGQAGGSALQNMAEKRRSILSSLGLGDTGGAKLPDTTLPPGIGSAPGLGGNLPPGLGGYMPPGQVGGGGSDWWNNGGNVGYGPGTTSFPGGPSNLPLPKNPNVPRPSPSGGDARAQPPPPPPIPRTTPTPQAAPSSSPRVSTPVQPSIWGGVPNRPSPAPPPPPRTNPAPAPVQWPTASAPAQQPYYGTPAPTPAPWPTASIPTQQPYYGTPAPAPTNTTTSLVTALRKLKPRIF